MKVSAELASLVLPGEAVSVAVAVSWREPFASTPSVAPCSRLGVCNRRAELVRPIVDRDGRTSFGRSRQRLGRRVGRAR